MNLGPTELIVILVIVLLLFGGAKLPKLARSLGEAKKEFEKGTGDGNTNQGTVETTTTTVVAETKTDEPADKGPIT